MGFKSGFVTVIGKTNVGKSSLINEMIGEQISIVVNKSQTTRKVARGIYTDAEAQIVFVDSPGLHKANSKLGTTMNEAATSTLEDVDVVIEGETAEGGVDDVVILSEGDDDGVDDREESEYRQQNECRS